MQLNCPSCAAVVAADDIDLPSATAKCRGCQALFSFRERLEAPPPPLSREAVGLPERFFLEERDGALAIGFSNRRPGAVGKAVSSAISAVLFVVFFYFHYTQKGTFNIDIFAVFSVVVLLLFLLDAAQTLFNTTEVRVEGARVLVKIGPVPARGQLELPTSSITQVFCTAAEHRSKNHRWRSYNVVAKTRDNREQTVLKGLETDRQALFIEQQIEKKLGIQDKPIAGELPK